MSFTANHESERDRSQCVTHRSKVARLAFKALSLMWAIMEIQASARILQPSNLVIGIQFL